MNHLHQLIQDDIFVPDELMYPGSPLAEALLYFEKVFAKQAHCFDLGGFGEGFDFYPSRVDLPVARLPFEHTWFEFDFKHGSEAARCGVAASEAEGALMVCFFIRHEGRGWGVVAHAEWDNCELSFEVEPRVTFAPPGQSAAGLLAIWRCVGAALTVMACTNVERRLNEPDAKLQKARVRRGKPPLFSFYTLHLKGKAPSSGSAGGTHASPRIHVRRGHAREFRPGEWTWVQASLVGDKSQGLIHKDYSLRSEQDRDTEG